MLINILLLKIILLCACIHNYEFALRYVPRLENGFTVFAQEIKAIFALFSPA